MDEILKKNYEVSYLVSNEEDASVIWKYLDGHKAEVESKSSLSLITLSYPIKKHAKAYFGYARFTASPAEIALLNDQLRLDAKVIRHLIIMPPKKREVVERRDPSLEKPKAKKPAVGEMSNEALEARLASLTGK